MAEYCLKHSNNKDNEVMSCVSTKLYKKYLCNHSVRHNDNKYNNY